MVPKQGIARCWVLLLALWSVSIVLMALPIRADSMDDDYVRQVIEEDQQHYNDYYAEEDHHVEDRERRLREQEERAAQEAADRLAAQREQQFKANLDKIQDEEQRKKALKQKKLDGKRVKTILKAAQKQDYYKVLGLRNWSLKIPSRQLDLFGTKLTIPGISLLGGITEKDIKKQFRNRAMQVHPDKNTDGRAQEAFVAVQEAAAVLSDPKQRKRYDLERKTLQEESLANHKQLVAGAVAYAWATTRKIIAIFQKLLGPFFVPVVIIGALII